MPGFSGSGQFVRTYNWSADKASGIKITATRNDEEDTGIADGLSNLLLLDGQQTTTGPISFAVGAKVSNGSVGSASVAFITDGDTGLYRIGANNIGLACGGTKIIDIATATVSCVATLVLGVPLTVARGGNGVSTTNSSRCSNSASFSMESSANTSVTFDTEEHDTNSLHSTSANTERLIAPIAGTYIITGHMFNTNPPTNTFFTVAIKKNGSSYLAQNSATTPDQTPSDTHVDVTAIAQLAANDYVEMEMYIERSSGNHTSTDFEKSSLNMVRVSA